MNRYDELKNIEYTITRAVNAAVIFADSAEKRELNKALQIVAEIRHAAMFLCDNPRTEIEKLVTERLVQFIKG